MKSHLLLEEDEVAGSCSDDLRAIDAMTDVELERITLDLIFHAFAKTGAMNGHRKLKRG